MNIKKSFLIGIGFFMAVSMVLILFSLYSTRTGAYHLDGDNVWWDNSYGKIVVWPHTSHQLITHTQYANITSYIPANINLDIAFEFDEPLQGNKNIWLWKNITHKRWIINFENYTYLKLIGNDTNQENICESWGCMPHSDTYCNCTGKKENGGYWDDNYYFDWKKITDLFTHSQYNGKHFYWIKNVNFDTDETKQVKWQYDQPFNTTGKWSLWIKRNSDTIEEALENGMYIKLDPWWDSNWNYKVNISIEENGGVERINEIADVWVNLTTGNCSKEYRIIDENAATPYELTSQVYNETYNGDSCVSANILFMVNITGNEHKNYTLYWDNPSASFPSYTPLIDTQDNFISTLKTQKFNVSFNYDSSNFWNNWSITFKNLSTTEDANGAYSVLSIWNQDSNHVCFFNNSIEEKGALMVKTYRPITPCNISLKIYPYYAELFVENNGTDVAIRPIIREKYHTSGAYPNYTFFGNETMYKIPPTFNTYLVSEENQGNNKTYIFGFTNSTQNGFLYAFENLTASFSLRSRSSSNDHGISYNVGSHIYNSGGNIKNASFKIRFKLENNFSDTGWLVARNERIKMENPLTYNINLIQSFSEYSNVTYNISDDNWQTKAYETSKVNYNITIWANYSILDFIEAKLVRNEINHGVDSNNTNHATNKTIYEKSLTLDLVDVNGTTYNSYWNLTLFYLNGSIINEKSTTRTQEVDWGYVITSVTTKNTNIFEGDNIIANATITKTISNATNFVWFDFQNVNYSATQSINTSTEEKWWANISTNIDDTGTRVLFAWMNVSFNNSVKTRISLSNTSITINKIWIDNCSNFSTVAYNFFLKDEETLNDLNGSFEGTFWVWKTKGKERNFSFSELMNTSWSLCIYPHWLNLTANAHIMYKNASTHVTRAYFLRNAELSNKTQNFSLYSLSSTSATAFRLRVLDNARIAKSDAYISSQRYYPGTNSYKVVEMGRTDANGESSMYFVLNSVDYKFTVHDANGNTIISTIPQRMICHQVPCILELIVTEGANPFEDINPIAGLSRTLVYNNQTNVVRLEWTDSTGRMHYARLYVIKRTAEKDIVICDYNETTATGALVCDVSAHNGTFIAWGRFAYSPDEADIWISFKHWVSNMAKDIFGTEGIWWAIMLIIALGLAGYWNPAVAVMTIMLGVIVTAFFGLVSLSYTLIIGIVAVGIGYMISLKT